MKCFPWSDRNNRRGRQTNRTCRGEYTALLQSVVDEVIIDDNTIRNTVQQRQEHLDHQMKTDRRKCFMAILGVVEIVIGSLFLALALWAFMMVRLELYSTGLSPVFLAVLSYVGGGLTVYGPQSTNKNMILLVIGVSTFTCFLSLALGGWMFVSLMRSSVTPDVTSYKSLMTGLNVLLMLDTAVIGASTWTVWETVNSRRRNRRPTDPFRDPPPAYFPPSARVVFTGETVTQANGESPPPYVP